MSVLTSRRTKWAAAVATALVLAGAALVIERGGLLAWAACALGLLLLTKILLRPSPADLVLSLLVVAVGGLGWAVTKHRVVSAWESAEVVELMVDMPGTPHTVRLWVVDRGATPILLYVAEPEIADLLVSGQPVTLERAGAASVKRPTARPVEAVPEAERVAINQLFAAKYGHLGWASELHVRVMGQSRDRVALIVELD